VKTEAQILETLAAIRAALPKAGPAPERVEVGEISAKRGMLRVTLTNARGGYELIGEWGHGVVSGSSSSTRLTLARRPGGCTVRSRRH
jgi:hypothetical protein